MATDNMGIRVNRSRTLGEIGQLRLKRIDKALTRFIIIVVETNLRILHPCFPFERKKNNNIDYPNDFRMWWHTSCCFFSFFFFSFFFFQEPSYQSLFWDRVPVVCNIGTAIPHGLKMLEQGCDLVGKFASFVHPSELSWPSIPFVK